MAFQTGWALKLLAIDTKNPVEFDLDFCRGSMAGIMMQRFYMILSWISTDIFTLHHHATCGLYWEQLHSGPYKT